MYNDFVIIGPAADPAGIAGLRTAPRRCGGSPPPARPSSPAATAAAPMRRSCGSGRWPGSILRPAAARGTARWARGWAPALNAAAAQEAYLLADRGTWLAFRNRQDLRVLVEGDQRLFNQYGVMAVSPARHPHVKSAEAERFIAWLVGPPGQAAIAAYRIGGEQLFFPNAGRPGA